MSLILANIAGALGLAAGFTVFTNLSLQSRHSVRYLSLQFLFLFVPLLVLSLWVQMPTQEALIIGGTGASIAIFCSISLAVFRTLDRDWSGGK